MKKHLLIQILFIILLVSSLITVHAASVKYSFNPALDGGTPGITIFPNPSYQGPTTQIIITNYVVDAGEIVLSQTTIYSNVSSYYLLSTRNKRDYLGVRGNELIGNKNHKLLDFRALYDSGESLMKYPGNSKLVRPDDFESYWAKSIQKLADYPMNPEIKLVPGKKSATGKLYQVKLNSWGNIPIYGWYFVPKEIDPLSPVTTGKKYPVIQFMPGYGGSAGPIDRTAKGIITFALSPRGFGEGSTYFKLRLPYHLMDLDNLDKTYYRQAYLDLVRGIDFISSRPEIDTTRIAAQGGSQGGAYCLALSAIDHRLCSAVAIIPALSNFWDLGVIGRSGTSITWLGQMLDPVKGKAQENSMRYLDTANMATLIRCPILIAVGLQDMTCPALGGIVAYNRVSKTIPKKLVIDPEAGHTTSPLMNKEINIWWDKYLLR